MKLGIVLKKLREEKGYTIKQLSEKTGISNGNLGDIERGKIEAPRRKTLEKISEALRLNKEEKEALFLGLIPDELKKNNFNFKIIKTKKVPLYGTASAGSGYLNLNEEVEEGFLIPEEDYKEGRFTIKVEGNSMTGLIKSIPCGSIALVDPMMCTDFIELVGKVCVFTYNSETYIKQLLIDTQNFIHLVSFNPDIQDIIVVNPKLLKCEGRVIKTFSEQKW
jgi:phage repressor protein C with HTH and peptisase S24 domain